MIKLKSLLNESSPGFENRQVGDPLPTLDSIQAAYQEKQGLQEAESFTATSKNSGKTTVFKSKSNRDAAIKAGTHEKAAKGGDSPPAGNDTSKADKPNMFSKDTGYDAGDKSKSKPTKAKFKDFKRDIESTMTDMGFSSADLGGLDGVDDFEDSDGNYVSISKGKVFGDDNKFSVMGGKVDDRDDVDADTNYQSFNSKEDAIAYAKELAGNLKGGKEEPKSDKSSEPTKDSTQQRAGNEQVNKVVRNKAKSLGVTPQKLGKEEYEKRMSQAAVEALTDANFHSESRALIAVLEDNPELAKNPSDDPNKPDMFSDEYDEWKKGTAWGSSFGDSSDGTDDIAHSATGESSWDGQESIDAIAFDLKMNGSHKLAAKIQSIFNEKNESTTKLTSMINRG